MSRTIGLCIGIVTNVDDPAGQARIQVDIPALEGRTRTGWAPVAAPMAGNDRGFCFMPEIGDEAVISFIADDPEQPVILGYTWNGTDRPPTQHPRERVIRSLNGHTIRLIDGPPGAQGAGSVSIEDANGNVVSLSNGKIRLDAVAAIEINAPVIMLSGDGWQRVVSPINAPI
jgi:phage baseplate assembly protein V